MRRFLEAILRRLKGGDGVPAYAHELERLIGYRFASQDRLVEALTHRSTIGELKPGEERISYERLEFLGDSVLSLVTSDFLMRTYPEENEGQLTKKKSLLVSKGVLSKKADEIGIKPYIILSESAERGGVADQDSVLTAALEALIGAIYLDGGFEKARAFIEDRILGDIDEFLEHRDHVNYKSILQELVQSRYHSYPRYGVKSTTGPEHDKIFIIEVRVAGKPVGKGRGKSKKDAEQMAAKEALNTLRKTHGESRRKW
jgi:ribonuclease-3